MIVPGLNSRLPVGKTEPRSPENPSCRWLTQLIRSAGIGGRRNPRIDFFHRRER